MDSDNSFDSVFVLVVLPEKVLDIPVLGQGEFGVRQDRWIEFESVHGLRSEPLFTFLRGIRGRFDLSCCFSHLALQLCRSYFGLCSSFLFRGWSSVTLRLRLWLRWGLCFLWRLGLFIFFLIFEKLLVSLVRFFIVTFGSKPSFILNSDNSLRWEGVDKILPGGLKLAKLRLSLHLDTLSHK